MNKEEWYAKEQWSAYWQARGFPWRTEPEIDTNRQKELSQRRAADLAVGYGPFLPASGSGPFQGMKLTRADVEWLLATHDGGQGPVNLNGAHLEGTNFSSAHLEGARLEETHLEGANLLAAHLEGAHLRGAHLKNADLTGAHLEGADLTGAHLEGADLWRAHLEGADLWEAHLEGDRLLEGARLSEAHLENANLQEAHLKNADLTGAHLEGANLDNIHLADDSHVGPRVADLRWGETILAVVDWSQVAILGDEYLAQLRERSSGVQKINLDDYDYKRAIRANRQLAIVLQDQGLNEEAARFAYRAQVLQRKVLWQQRNFWKWLGSAILALLAGYGYRMWRILIAYLFVVLLCAVAYFVLDMHAPHPISFLEAVLTSITAFHGRVFSSPFPQADEPELWVTAFEAVAGLVIEGVFIAMLTQKFFGK